MTYVTKMGKTFVAGSRPPQKYTVIGLKRGKWLIRSETGEITRIDPSTLDAYLLSRERS